MGTQRITSSDLQRTWGWALLMGAAASVFSLMLGLFLQTVFYEIAGNLPPVIRQDAHVSLPLCNPFPDLYGCDAWVGALTSLEIWELSLQVGRVSGLLADLILVAVVSMWVAVRVGSDSALPGLLTGIAGLLSSLALALVFDVPMNLRSPWGIFGILMLLLLPFLSASATKAAAARWHLFCGSMLGENDLTSSSSCLARAMFRVRASSAASLLSIVRQR